jgi:hypothetical protein
MLGLQEVSVDFGSNGLYHGAPTVARIVQKSDLTPAQ